MDASSRALRRRFTKGALITLGIAAIVGGAVLWFLLSSRVAFFAVNGDSMEPTLNNGDTLVLQQAQGIEKEQIIVFSKPSSWKYLGDTRPALIKRVAAAPGDTLSFQDEGFYVNGELIYALEEDSYECLRGEEGYTHTLTLSEAFVLGDNASVSLDSRRIFCDGQAEDMFVEYRHMIDHGTIRTLF